MMYAQINANTINEIKARADIVEIVSEKVRLQKKGRYYFGRCPFHLEDTPSFSVSHERQMYYCFGCHAGGDVLSFVMNTEGLSFTEAVESLGERYNIAVSASELSQAEKKHLEEKEQLYQINGSAVKWFEEQLFHTQEGKLGLAYLKDRGLTDDIISAFKLGFAPSSWDKLTQTFVKKGIPVNLLVNAGLTIENPGNPIHDRFRNRIIFPITDYRGRVVAFGGRVLDDSLPKYLNSPETAVFNKSQSLYGLSLAAQIIRQKNEAVLVEGYMDVITCHQNGIKNAVASLGTALTAEQGKLLLRYCDKVYFAYDTDNAGRKAIQKGIYTLTDLGLHLKVITYPDSKDPDEYLKKHSSSEFNELLNHAQSSFAFLLDYLIAQKDLTNPTEKAEVVKEIFPFINRIADMVVREEYLKQTAFALSVNESAVYTEFRKFQKKLPTDVNFSQKIGKNTHVNSKQKNNLESEIDKMRGKILAQIIQDVSLRKNITQLIDFPFSTDENVEAFYKKIIEAGEPEPEQLISSLPEEMQSFARYILFNEKFLLEGKEKIEDIIAFLNKQYIKQRIEEVNSILATFNFSAGLTEEFKGLLAERQKLQSQLK